MRRSWRRSQIQWPLSSFRCAAYPLMFGYFHNDPNPRARIRFALERKSVHRYAAALRSLVPPTTRRRSSKRPLRLPAVREVLH